MPLEIEIKLTCEPAVLARIGRHPAVRALKLGRARTEHLVSRYFDTPDTALRRAGLALRVRSTPRGWVQTLKGEGEGIAGLQTRPEWEWPVPSQAVAGDLLADTPALKALGGKKKLALALASLAPRFETAFKRTIHALRFVDGTQAELCLDLGQLRARDRIEPICEAEIELRGTGGDRARLYALSLSLVDSLPVRLGYLSKAARGHALSLRERSQPARALPVALDKGMRRADAFRTVATACMEQMQANEAGLIAGRDVEYLHQMRVAIRRLRSAFAVFRGCLAADALAPVAAAARALGQGLGAARDWDVFYGETLRVIARTFPDEKKLAALARRAARRRGLQDRAARAAVQSPQYVRGLLRLAQLLAETEKSVAPDGGHLEEPLHVFAAQVLQQRHRRVRNLGERLPGLSAEELHHFRISAKKLRYAAEFFHALFPGRRTRGYARALSGLQDTLGGLNDVTTAERLLKALRTDAVPDAMTDGIMRGWNASRRQQHLDSLPLAWKKFRAQTRFWRRSLPPPAPLTPAMPERGEESQKTSAIERE